MTPGTIKGATTTLGQPETWDEAEHGRCAALAVRQGEYTLESAWVPNEAEKAAIAAGAPVILTIWGMAHPPVSVNVEGVDP